MIVYPFNKPVILTTNIFVEYGGKTGSFSQTQLENAFTMAEQQTVSYIGTFLLPTIVTGTYSTSPTHTQRIATDYGYVHQILGANILTQKITYGSGVELVSNVGGAFIYEDTFGYLDVYKLHSICGCPHNYSLAYQYQISYEAGLPTGTANLPLVLAAMTLAAKINLNEMYPGEVGMNEGVGDVGIQEFESFGYHERRTAHSLVKTAFGGSAQASKIASMIKTAVKLARRSLKVS
jgi:hypothetical protein